MRKLWGIIMKKSSQEVTDRFLNLIYPQSMELITSFTSLDTIFTHATETIMALQDRVKRLEEAIDSISNSERKTIVDLNEANKQLKAKYSADVSYLNKMCNEQLKDYQEQLFKNGMVVMKDGKVVKLEDFFIKEPICDTAPYPEGEKGEA